MIRHADTEWHLVLKILNSFDISPVSSPKINMIGFLAFTVAILIVAVTSKPCNVSDNTYQGLMVPWVSVSSAHQVTGLIRTRAWVMCRFIGMLQVLDGCTFALSQFGMQPAGLNVYFYGSQSVSDSNGFRINPTPLGTFIGVNLNVSLTGEQGSGFRDTMHSWSEFKVVKVYNELEGAVYGYAVLDSVALGSTTSDSPMTLAGWISLACVFLFSILTLVHLWGRDPCASFEYGSWMYVDKSWNKWKQKVFIREKLIKKWNIYTLLREEKRSNGRCLEGRTDMVSTAWMFDDNMYKFTVG